MTKEKIVREKPVPEHKLKQVKTIAEKMKNSGSVLIASMRGLPASQFQKIKKSLRGKAEITVAKRSIVLRESGCVFHTESLPAFLLTTAIDAHQLFLSVLPQTCG